MTLNIKSAASALSKRKPVVLALASLVLLLASMAAYWPGLSGPFLFDDYPNIVDNAAVHADVLNADSVRRALRAYEPGEIGRPLATLSFAFDWRFSGDKPWLYKFDGLLVHVVNALLVLLLLRALAAVPLLAGRYGLGFCFAVALAWSIHPLQVSTVLYVVQRMESLSLTFVLLALSAYVHGRTCQIQGRGGWAWLVASAVIASLGLLSKETAVLFPVYTLALELALFRFSAVSARSSRLLVWAYGAAALVGLFLFFGWALPRALAPFAFSGRDFTLVERLLSQCRILPMYIGQALLPLPGALIFYYDSFQKSTGWLAPATTLWGGLCIVGLLALAIVMRKRLPLFSLGIFWFFAAHLLTSNVLNLELVFEHRNYFALLGLMVSVATLVHAAPLRDGPGLRYVLTTSLLSTLMVLCLIRSAIWGNGFLLFNDLVDINPNSPRARTALGIELIRRADGDAGSFFYGAGKQQFEAAAALPGASTLPEQGLILMATAYNQPVDPLWWQGLLSKLRTLPLSAEVSSSVYDLVARRYRGVVLDDRRLREACMILLQRGRQPAYAYAQFGDYALRYLHDEEMADAMFVASITKDPSDRAYANKILGGLLADGRKRQADAVLRRGVELGIFERSGSP